MKRKIGLKTQIQTRKQGWLYNWFSIIERQTIMYDITEIANNS